MARLNIDVGTLGNAATGDTLRTAMVKINTNFTEVYSLVRDGSSGLIATDVTNGDLKLQANGTGVIEIDTLQVNGDAITSIATNGSVDITGNGTGGVNIEALTFNGTSISSSDSSRINLNENVTVDGDLVVTGSIAGTFTVSSLDADSSTVSNLEVDNFKASAIVIESEGIGSNDNDTTLPTSAAVKDYVDTNSVTASESATFTNKTFDANGTGNSISNLEVADFAAASIVTEAEGIGSNDNDTTIPTSAAVKDYVDARDIGDLSVTGSTISAPSNADLTLTTSGTGSVSIDGIQISGTEISSSDSTQVTIKENLHVTGNISGTITGTVSTLDADNTTVSNIEVDNFKAATIVLESEGIGSNDNDTTIPTSAAVKDYVDNNAGGTTGDLAITGSSITAPSNADLTLSAGGTGSVDIEGIQIKGTEISSSDSTQVTIKENLHVTGNITGTINANQLSGTLPAISGELLTGVAKHSFKTIQIGGGNTLVADDAVDTLTIHPGNNVTITDDQSLDSFTINVNGMGDLTFVGSTIISPSNADITLDPAGTGQVVANAAVKFNAGYVEKINTLTSSSTITVDCSAASIHTVTLATNTEFNISNLPTGGTVTLIITQDGTGSRTATFGTDGSTAVKFPGGAPTLSTGAGDIDVVTIVNDGTNFLGNCAKDYS